MAVPSAPTKSDDPPAVDPSPQRAFDVLLVSNPIGVGGLPRYMAEHAAALVQLGLRLDVLIPDSPGARFVEERLAQLHTEPGLAPRVQTPDSLSAISLWRHIRREPPALVRMCTGKAPPDTRLSLGVVLSGVPMLESMHLPPNRRAKAMQRLFYRLRPKQRYLATNNTQGMHEKVTASAPALHHRMMQLSEGVDLTLFKPSGQTRRSGPIRLISVSRLSESHKDISTLIAAASLLRDRGIEFELTIVGDGEDKAILERRAADEGLIENGRVRFVGWVEDVPGLLGASDIFVNSTHFESFGRTNIEAAACGLPVVASRVIGCVESVSDGENGVLVEPAHANALANTLQDLIEHPDKRRSLGDAGVRFAQGFSMLAHTQRVIEIANQRLNIDLSVAEH